MTKQEAINEMKKGNKVSHMYFSNDEFITMEDNYIIDENGYKLDPFEFWKYRQSDYFNNDWHLYNK